MNKKGFTLIELLAVVFVLGIIAVIAVSFVGNLIEDSEKDSYIENARLLEKSAKDYFTVNPGKVPQTVSSTATVTLATLISENLTSNILDPADSSIVCSTTNSYVIIEFKGDRKYDYTVTLTCGDKMIFEEISGDLTHADIVASTF